MTDSIRQQIISNIDIRQRGIKIAANQVIGSDSKNYTCIYPHLSAAANKPITGASWETYWSQVGSSGVVWASDQYYSSGGYQTDLGSNINWWRDLEKNPLQSTEVPGAILKDEIDNPEPFTMGYDLHNLRVSIALAANTQEQMRQIVADVIKAVNVDLTWAGLALHTLIENDESEVEHLDQKYLGTMMVMMVQFKTIRGNPLSQ